MKVSVFRQYFVRNDIKCKQLFISFCDVQPLLPGC